MSIMRRDPRTMFPDLVDWFEEPFLTLRPYLGQAIRIEDYTEDGHYVVRAEIAGIDPEKDLEIAAGSGYLTIRAHRASAVEDKHRSEFRYGSFSRTIELPAGADGDDVTAEYAKGILTVRVGLKEGKKEVAKKIPVTTKELTPPNRPEAYAGCLGRSAGCGRPSASSRFSPGQVPVSLCRPSAAARSIAALTRAMVMPSRAAASSTSPHFRRASVGFGTSS